MEGTPGSNERGHSATHEQVRTSNSPRCVTTNRSRLISIHICVEEADCCLRRAPRMLSSNHPDRIRLEFATREGGSLLRSASHFRNVSCP